MPRRRSRRARSGRLLILLLASGLAAGAGTAYWGTRPLPVGRRFYVRYPAGTPVSEALAKLQEKGVVRSSLVTGLVLRALGAPTELRAGTYSFAPGDGVRALRQELAAPVTRLVRLREMRWIARTARSLQRAGVCSAAAYRTAASNARAFRAEFPFVPESGSLEGYLYPDTYDLPPLTPAEDVVRMQLREFGRRVAPTMPTTGSRRLLTLASLVEMEASDPTDRRRIAGVIENRIRRGMRLQIDATVNYGRQKWGRLFFRDYTGVRSPYNTYLIKGLPPGPICSPTAASVAAARAPIPSDALYYVALPDGTTIYAATFAEHRRNIARRLAMIAAASQNKDGGAPTLPAGPRR